MSLISQIIKHQKHRSQLIGNRNIVNRRISVLTNGINALKFMQKIHDKNRRQDKNEHQDERDKYVLG